MSRTEVVEGQVWEWVESSCVMRGESKRGKQETTLWKGTVIERQNIMKFWNTILLQRSSRKEKRHGYERRQNAQKEKGQMGDRVTAYV